MSLSPAAAALEADLCLLTRLPLPKEADLDAIKERVFGSVEGVPRTEDESRRRYVDAIVEAFNASEAESLDDFPLWVRDLANGRGTLISTINALNAEMLHRNGLTAKLRQERDQARSDADRYGEGLKAAGANRRTERKEQEQLLANVKAERDEARAALAKAHERIERLQEINERLETRNREATQAGASFGVETCGLLAEKDATIRDVRATFDDLFVKWETTCRERDAARREATASRAELCALNAEISHLRSDLASTRAAHAEITAAHAKLAADLAHKDRLMRDMNTALKHAREEAEDAHTALSAEQGRTERLRAVMVDLIADLNAAKEGDE